MMCWNGKEQFVQTGSMTAHLNCVTFQPERPVVGDEKQETALIGRAANGLKRAPISPPFLLAATAEPIWAETLDADDGRYLSAACLPVSWMSKVVCNQDIASFCVCGCAAVACGGRALC